MAACIAVAALEAVPAAVYAAGRKPRQTDGPYHVRVSGSYAGAGQAVVAGPIVLLTAEVTNGSGPTC